VGKETLVHGWWKEMKRKAGVAAMFSLKTKGAVVGLLGIEICEGKEGERRTDLGLWGGCCC